FAELKFLENFTFRTSIGGDFAENELRNFAPVYEATLSQRRDISLLRRERVEDRNWILENTLTYNRNIDDKHIITVLLGQGAQQYRYYKLESTAENVPNNSEGDHYLTLGNNRFVDDEGDLYTIASYFARVNYSL